MLPQLISMSDACLRHRAEFVANFIDGAGAQPYAEPRPVVTPTAAERFKIQFTASSALHDKLREAQALLRHQVPSGDIAEIFERALDGLLKDTKKKRFGVTDRPRDAEQRRDGKPSAPRSRHIPNAIKRAVVARDGGQCTYVDAHGNRCSETARVEFHHIAAYARGGAHTVDNLTLRCAAHNRFEAERELGRDVVEDKINRARQARRAATLPGKSSPALLLPTEVREPRPTYSITRSDAPRCRAQRQRAVRRGTARATSGSATNPP